MIIYYAPLTLYKKEIILAATNEGLVFVSAPFETIEDIKKHISKYEKDIRFKFSLDKLQPYMEDFEAVANGDKQNYDSPYVLYGTDFQKQVWHALAEIPYGQTRTYSEIAQSINRPKAYRAVGTAVGRNPLMLRVPCHRIIHKNGSLKGFRGGMDLKMTLLDKEDVLFEE